METNLFDPRFYPVCNQTMGEWRYKLKMYLLEKRGYKSDWSGKPLTDLSGAHLHEGIVTRATVNRSLWWHYLIFSEVNCFLLLPEEHIPLIHGLNREWCIQKAYELYGREAVREWYESLPFKVKPFILE